MTRLRRGLAVLGTALAIAIAAAVFDWHSLLSSVGRMPLASFVECASLCCLTSLVLAVRWAVIVTTPEAPLRAGEILVALKAAVFNLITPAALGADVYRIGRGSGQRVRRFGLVLVERLFGIWAQTCIYAAAFLLAPWPAPAPAPFVQVAWVFGGMTVIGAVAIVAMPRLRVTDGRNRIGVLLADLSAALTHHSVRKRLLLGGLSVSGVLTWIAACFVLARGGALPLSFPQVAMITIVTEFARLVPIAVQGIGVREAVFAWLAHLLGAAAEEAFVVCALAYAVNALVIGGTGSVATLVLARLDRAPVAWRKERLSER